MRIVFFLLLTLSLTILPHVVSTVNGQEGQASRTAPAPEKDLGSRDLLNVAEDIRDIHGPLLIPESSLRVILLSVAAVLLLVLLCSLYLFWKHRRSAPTSRVSAAQTALSELDDIRTCMTSEQAFFYMERVSDILRRYIERRFSVPCTRRTSCEFIQTVQNMGSVENNPLWPFSSELKKCLEMCDMAKFSGRRPIREEMVQVDQAVRVFIEKTDEQPKIPGER